MRSTVVTVLPRAACGEWDLPESDDKEPTGRPGAGAPLLLRGAGAAVEEISDSVSDGTTVAVILPPTLPATGFGVDFGFGFAAGEGVASLSSESSRKAAKS